MGVGLPAFPIFDPVATAVENPRAAARTSEFLSFFLNGGYLESCSRGDYGAIPQVLSRRDLESWPNTRTACMNLSFDFQAYTVTNDKIALFLKGDLRVCGRDSFSLLLVILCGSTRYVVGLPFRLVRLLPEAPS
jgi:hypothetical protein